MKLSAQEEYGLRCLIAIAREGVDGTLTIPEIAEREGLSQSHVAKLLSILRKAEFIRSTRGQAGGYTIARHPSRIIVGEVMAELGGRLWHDGFCHRHSGLRSECGHLGCCALETLWRRVQEAVDSVTYSFTLQDLLDLQDGKGDRVVELVKEPKRSQSISS